MSKSLRTHRVSKYMRNSFLILNELDKLIYTAQKHDEIKKELVDFVELILKELDEKQPEFILDVEDIKEPEVKVVKKVVRK